MRSIFRARLAFAALSAIGATAAASNASAAIDCNTLTNPVYVTGSSAVRPFMEALGAALYGTGPTIIYQQAGSCVGVTALVGTTTISGTAKYYPNYTDAGAPNPTDCNLPSPDGGTGQPVDLGVSDVFAESCPGGTRDATKVGDFWGPNQVMVFIAPQIANDVVNISAEAAYFVMGQAANAKSLTPWTDATKLFVRNASSGTQTMIATAIHLDAASWHGTDAGSATAVLNFVQTANTSDPAPRTVLGIVSTGESDTARANVKVLGFQPLGTSCAYWPDSSLSSFDKKYVRSGDYQIWGPLHMLAKVASTGGRPTNPNVDKIVGYFDGTVMPPAGKTQIVDIEIANHTVPQCAMKVKRSSELGAYTPNNDAGQCGCYFDLKATGNTTCTPCKMDADCADAGANHVCSYGYCEAK